MWTRRTTPVQPYHDDAKWKWCSAHVRILADIIAALGVLLGVLQIIEAAIWGPLWNLAEAIILIIICGFIIVADRTEKSIFYLPYLVISIILILLYLALGIALLVLGIVLPQKYVKKFSEDGYTNPRKSARIFAFVTMGIIFVILIIALWAWHIVFKAYKFMKDVVEYHKRAIAPETVRTQQTTQPQQREMTPMTYSEGAPTYRFDPGYSYV